MIEYIVVNVKTGKVLLKTEKKWEAINFMTELYEYSGDYENIFLKEIDTSKKKANYIKCPKCSKEMLVEVINDTI